MNFSGIYVTFRIFTAQNASQLFSGSFWKSMLLFPYTSLDLGFVFTNMVKLSCRDDQMVG